ncbi:MAG: lipoprotein [Woeseiaceae bacterium]
MKLLIAVLAALILCGCGQSGPLYIPGNPSRIENPPPAEDAAEEEAEEREQDGNTGD